MSRRINFAISLALLVALLLPACAPAAAPAGTEAPAPAATTKPEGAGEPIVVTFLLQQDFLNMNPADAWSIEPVFQNMCYENLVWATPPGSAEKVVPGLATSWEKNEDATEWTFHLRQGVTFQDGAPFNADAVKATFDYIIARGSGYAWVYAGVDSIEAVDEYTVKFNLSYPQPMDLMLTAPYGAGIMSPNILDKDTDWFNAGNCVGTGPYMIESYTRGERMILTRYDDYWGGWEEGEPDKAILEIVMDPPTAVQMMESGEGDFYLGAPPDTVLRLGQTEGLYSVITDAYYHTLMLLNTKRPPLDDVRVREALAWSFPYQEVIDRSEGIYKLSRGFVPLLMWGNCTDCMQYHQDLDKARDLLTEAGYPDGGFTLIGTYAPDWPGVAWPMEEWVQPLSELGITLKLEPGVFETVYARAIGPEEDRQDIFPEQWWPDWVTPGDPLKSMFSCQEEELFYNLSYWCDPEFDALLEEANKDAGVSLDLAAEKYIEAQHILMEELPAFPTIDPPLIWLVSSRITTFNDNPAYPGEVFFHDLRVEQ
jgi:peptide/nickel transport system substrate-binding protein